MYKYYCGIDLHKCFSVVCVMNQEGEICREAKLYHQDGSFEAFFCGYKDLECVVETVDNWGWACDFLQEQGHQVHLAHTYKVRLIAESRMKTDKIDAKILADLLRTNFLPESYIASVKIRDDRCYYRYRIQLACQRARLKIQIHRLLRLENIDPPKGCKKLFGKAGRFWLKNIKLRDVHERIKVETLELMDLYDKQISRLDKEMREKSKQGEVINHLKTIPGVGDLISQVVLSEVGDMHRFKSSKKFSSYCGLVPSQKSSADKIRFGKITKQGNTTLRWLLVEAAKRAKIKDPGFRLFFDRIAIKKGKSKATIAVARRIAEVVWHVVTTKQDYDPNKILRHRRASPAL